MLQPINVAVQEDGSFQIVTGERRFRAAKAAGHDTIPAVIRDASWGVDTRIAALTENVARADLSPVEEAAAYAELAKASKLKPAKLAPMVGRSARHITERLALLELPEVAQTAINEGRMPARCAASILAIAKISVPAAEALTEYACLDGEHAGEVADRLHDSIRDLNQELSEAREDYEPVCVVPASRYGGSLNEARAFIPDELAERIEAVDGRWFISVDEQDGDAAIAYGGAIRFKRHANDQGTVYVLDQAWLVDCITRKVEEHEKTRRDDAPTQEQRQQEAAARRDADIKTKAWEREQAKTERRSIASRAHQRNVAIGRSMLRTKAKLDNDLTKALCVLALHGLGDGPGAVWRFVDERFGKPESRTLKDGATEFKLVFGSTPSQAKSELVELVMAAKNGDEALRITMGSIAAMQVVDQRATGKGNRFPAKLPVYHLGEELTAAFGKWAEQFDLPKEYELDGQADEDQADEPPATPTGRSYEDIQQDALGALDNETGEVQDETSAEQAAA